MCLKLGTDMVQFKEPIGEFRHGTLEAQKFLMKTQLNLGGYNETLEGGQVSLW